MKKFISITIIALLSGMLAVSCMKDDSYASQAKNIISYAVITSDRPNLGILTDAGEKLQITKNYVPQMNLKSGDRIIAEYKYIGQSKLEIELFNAIPLLTKKPVHSNDINTAVEQDAIGHDPIDLVDAWISSHYFNFNFKIYRLSEEKIHFINLVIDDKKTTAETIVFQLRHNSQGDPARYISFGRVSFDLQEILKSMNLDKGITVKIEWNSYHNGPQQVSFPYKK